MLLRETCWTKTLGVRDCTRTHARFARNLWDFRWHQLLAELESGPQGATRVAWCLENALRLTFPFTDTYHACRILFEVSLGKSFPPNLDTMELLTEVMKRTRAALQRC
jgi:hypothetical protein